MALPIIALVEDDEDLLQSYAQIFAVLGDVASFQRPQALLTRLNDEPGFKPSLVITDYKMPGMHGLELLERLNRAGLTCPAILISGNLEKDNLLSAHNLGVSRILEKPTRKQELLRVAQELLVHEHSLEVRRQMREISAAMRELFGLFRLVCNDELGLKTPSLPDAIASGEQSLSLNEALDDLERRLEALGRTEAELEHTLAQLKEPPAKLSQA